MNISLLQYEEEPFRRHVKDAGVYLNGAPVTSVQFSDADYNKWRVTTFATGAAFHRDTTKLQCNCRNYWTGLALGGAKLVEYGLCCTPNRTLRSMAVDEMVCPAADVCDGLPSVFLLMRTRCESAALTYLPKLPTAAEWEIISNMRLTLSKPQLQHHEDLQYRRTATFLYAAMYLRGAPVTLRLGKHDYKLSATAPGSGATVHLDGTLECNCNMYWTRLVLVLRCISHRALSNVSTDEMLCLAPEDCLAFGLPRACLCSAWPWCSAAGLVRARCESAARPLKLLSGTFDIDNYVLKNISKLRAADLQPSDDVPGPRTFEMAPHLRKLDLRNDVPTDDCAQIPLAAWIAGALLVLVAATATLVACFANQERRFTLFVILYKFGLLRRTAELNDGCLFDAFISFSHKDERFLREIVDQLESGRNPYRLCLHYRDWVPGQFIPDQIVESVRRSRRTVALVSRHFLYSKWTRAEFREAYGLAMTELKPRLVLVLLEDPTTLLLDAQLRHYLRSNMYLRWGDPLFWGKLQLALPIPQSCNSRPSSPATLAVHVAPIVLENPASKVSLGPPLQHPLPDDRQPKMICLESISPALNGNGSSTPISTPHPSRSPAIAVAS